MTAEQFAGWVEHMRATRGWTQRRCAEALGVHDVQIGRWLRHMPKSDVRLALACAAVAADLPAWPARGRPGPVV